MAKVKINENKIKSIARTLKESGFCIIGNGHFDLPSREYENFIKALMSNSPKKELQELYDRYR